MAFGAVFNCRSARASPAQQRVLGGMGLHANCLRIRPAARTRGGRLHRGMNSRQATAKMFVPADSSGGETPEAKGAVQLKRLFTFVAIRVVQAQLEGLGNDGGFAPQVTGRDGSVQSPDYSDLRDGMEEVPLGNGDQWVEAMLRRNPRLALRILEVRTEYCKEFDYKELERLTNMAVEAANTELMRRHVLSSTGMDSKDGKITDR